MKAIVRITAVFVLLIFLMSTLTLVALAGASNEDDRSFGSDEVSLSPGAKGLLASIGVDTTKDGLNDGDGQCSLREAVEAANTDTAVDACPAGSIGHDTINLPAGTYFLTDTINGDLVISSTLTIQGSGVTSPTIDGKDNDRVFDITDTGAVTISNVIIQNGSGVDQGGGIRNLGGTLALNNTKVTSNTANFDGGGIHNEDGVLTIIDSTISNNAANGDAGNSSGIGGGINNEAVSSNATVTITNSFIISNTVSKVGGGGISNNGNTGRTATINLNYSTVSNNVVSPAVVNVSTGFGGGIRNSYPAGASNGGPTILNINHSTISGNRATNGGGIGSGTDVSVTPNPDLRVTIESSIISNNTADGQDTDNEEVIGIGGGLFNVDGTMTVVNSTVSGNTATGGGGTGNTIKASGGGIANGGQTAQTTLWLTNTTVSSNTAGVSAGGLGNANLGTTFNKGTANLKNTILGNNSAPAGPDCAGTVESQGHNLVENTTNCTINGTTTGNVTGQDPLLGPLQDNGGDTETHALLTNSPADDAADTTVCAAAPVDGVDQRDATRGVDACDIGAYEASGAGVYLPIVVKSAS